MKLDITQCPSCNTLLSRHKESDVGFICPNDECVHFRLCLDDFGDYSPGTAYYEMCSEAFEEVHFRCSDSKFSGVRVVYNDWTSEVIMTSFYGTKIDTASQFIELCHETFKTINESASFI
jgi:hypothetical protein